MSKGRGRPVKYKGSIKKHLVKLVSKYGLTGAQTVAAVEGIEVSLPTLRKLAPNVELSVGRRKRAIAAA